MKTKKRENKNKDNKNTKIKKNKSFDTVRVTSIARKINLNNVGRLFLAYVGMDMLILIILSVVFVIGMDIQITGNFSLSYNREFSYNRDLWKVLYTVLDSTNERLYQIPVGIWFGLLRIGGLIVLAIQIFDLITVAFSGTAQVRRELRPLNQIAARAQELSEIAFDETKYHSLEDAITNLKVEAMENGIHMHDKDLQGIEIALNGLLERIRASYKQQTQFVSDASHELRTPIAVIQVGGTTSVSSKRGFQPTKC